LIQKQQEKEALKNALEQLSEREINTLLTDAQKFSQSVIDFLHQTYGFSESRHSLEKRIKMLQLKTACQEHKISLRYALQAIVPFWIEKKFFKRSIPVHVLIGRISMGLLQAAVERDFPQRENQQEWKQRERQRQMPEANSISTHNVDRYLKEVRAYQKQLSQATAMRRNKLHRYRGNPWQ